MYKRRSLVLRNERHWTKAEPVGPARGAQGSQMLRVVKRETSDHRDEDV